MVILIAGKFGELLPIYVVWTREHKSRNFRGTLNNICELLSNLVKWYTNGTKRMAVANGTCVSFCNQPKAHYLATSRKSRRYVVWRVAFGYVKRAQGTFWPPLGTPLGPSR